jgi:integral membrane protein (TIGR01906 family)
MPTQVARLLKIVVDLLLPILLVVGSVRLLVTDQYLALEYNKADFPSDPFGFDNAQRLAFAAANFRYVREAQPIETLANQRLGDSPLYNNRELKHMQDVQNAYQAIWRLWQIAVAVFALAALALGWRADTRPALIDAFKWGGLLTGGLIATVGLLAVVAWRVWFVAFHQIFFAPGTWMFNYSDTLIRLFPEKFWFDAAMTISGLTLIGGLLFAWVGWRLRVKTQAAPLSATLSASQS